MALHSLVANIAAAVGIFSLITGCAAEQDQTLEAVQRIIGAHSESTLQDIYKSFYQDRFGPGHMIASMEGAVNYFDSELTECTDNVRGSGYELTGDTGDYVRVDIELVKAGVISRDLLIGAFTQGAKAVNQDELDRWTTEWREIAEKIAKAGGMGLPGFEADRAMIDEILDGPGDHAIHHSERYSAAYDPHYRIVRRDIFEEQILPLLK